MCRHQRKKAHHVVSLRSKYGAPGKITRGVLPLALWARTLFGVRLIRPSLAGLIELPDCLLGREFECVVTNEKRPTVW